MPYKLLLHKAIIAAVLAGNEILKVYETNFDVEIKTDKSPVTLADKNASDKIIDYLSEFNIPVLSEEGEHPNYHTRQHWKQLWIVDPLDGTKEFVKRNGEFTVNIALVEEEQSVLGVIFSPIFKDIYFACKFLGSYKIDKKQFATMISGIENYSLTDLLQHAQKLPIPNNKKNFVVLASRSHLTTQTYNYINALKLKYTSVDVLNTGSSIKLCWVAEGVADEYPRFGPTMEWDTAAGNAILTYASATIIDEVTKQPMRYNKLSLFNNWFIAKANSTNE